MYDIPFVFSIQPIKNCSECKFYEDNKCFLTGVKIEYQKALEGKSELCPIIDDLSNKIIRRTQS